MKTAFKTFLISELAYGKRNIKTTYLNVLLSPIVFQYDCCISQEIYDGKSGDNTRRSPQPMFFNFVGVGLDSLDASEQGSLNSIPLKSSPVPTLQDSEVYCSEPMVTSFIKSFIPSAKLAENVGSELTYVLPAEMAREGRFQDLFEELDKSLDNLHIGSYGVSDTTLEEVPLSFGYNINGKLFDITVF